MGPLEAIRERCKDCSGYNLTDIRECALTDCELYPHRFGTKPEKIKGVKYKTPLQACRAYCLHCCENNKKEVRLCPSKDCPLYVFRSGKNENRKMEGEAKEKQIENIKKSQFQ